MAFQIKNFNSIVLAMLNNAKATQGAITDWNVGSAARTLVEVPAVELEEFYQRMLYGIIEAIPVAAYNAFGFNFTAARVARGSVNLNFTAPITDAFVIPSGTVFKNPSSGIAYLSQTDVPVTVGATSVSIVVIADQLDASGNTGADSLSQVLGAYVPSGTVVTHQAITSGTDAETDEQRMSRFAEFIGSLARGTPAAVMYAVKQAVVTDGSGRTIEQVTRAVINEVPGSADIFVYGSEGIASLDLLAAAQVIIDGVLIGDQYTAGYRPVGVRVRALPMLETSLDIPLTLTLTDHSASLDIIRPIGAALTLLFNATPSGSTLLIAEIIDTVVNIVGVQKVVVGLASNIVIGNNQVLKLGAVSVMLA